MSDVGQAACSVQSVYDSWLELVPQFLAQFNGTKSAVDFSKLMGPWAAAMPGFGFGKPGDLAATTQAMLAPWLAEANRFPDGLAAYCVHTFGCDYRDSQRCIAGRRHRHQQFRRVADQCALRGHNGTEGAHEGLEAFMHS